jgi:hypothetical protein
MTELTTGRNNFYMVGKVKINDNSLKDAEQKPGSSWLGVNTGFGLEIEEGNIIYPNIWGGRSLARGVLYGMNKETRKSVQIPFEDKNNETILDTLIPSNFRYAQIEKGDDGKLVEYRFLDDIDYVNYLQENLKHDMEVIVTGRATYSLGKPDEHGDMRIYKRYEISRVRLNETHEEDGEQVLNREHQASQNSTYLIDESALDKNWKKELENDGKVRVNGLINHYFSQLPVGGNYEEFKKIASVRQPFYIIAKTDEEKDKMGKFIKAFLKVSGDSVNVMDVQLRINEGFETGNVGDIELSDDAKELIAIGMATEEELRSQLVVRGARTSELIFTRVNLQTVGEGDNAQSVAVQKDLYTFDDLVFPEVEAGKLSSTVEDDDDFNDEPETTASTKATDLSDDDNEIFGDLFG